MLTLTQEATTAIEGILASPGIPDGAGLRITPAPGTNSSEPVAGLQVAVAEKPDVSDQVIEDSGARVFVQESVTDALADKELDVQVDAEHVSFTLGSQDAAG
jgi:iron-sulfur cluster assembly protein